MEVIVGITAIAIDLSPDLSIATRLVEVTYELGNGEKMYSELVLQGLEFRIVFELPLAPWWRLTKGGELITIKEISISFAPVAGGGYRLDITYDYHNGTTQKLTDYVAKFPFNIKFGSALKFKNVQ